MAKEPKLNKVSTSKTGKLKKDAAKVKKKKIVLNTKVENRTNGNIEAGNFENVKLKEILLNNEKFYIDDTGGLF